jgi:16S rRNA (guanine966-N2)-methyltransferase
VDKRRRAGAARSAPRLRNELRIIGGKWRGRRVQFPALPQLRPSPDRVRETLFNWLAPVIDGARCLDLFAGSGALGLEALSRGAGSVVLVDCEPQAHAALMTSIARLGATAGEVVCADAFDWLARGGSLFDIAFVDPPFGQGLAARACAALAASGRLTAGARVYVECEAEAGGLALPPGWILLRSQRAGRVGYHLAQAAAATAPAHTG